MLRAAGKVKGLPVQREITQCQHIRSEHFSTPAGHCPDPGQKLFRFKRLGKIIISARVQPFDLVLKLRFGGKHDHRSGDSFCPKCPQDIKAVHFWHHDIQDQAIIVSRQRIIQGVLSVVDDIDGVFIIC